MKNVADIFKTCSCPLSFEIFPPKGELTIETARSVAAELADLSPAFISVTYSAGGGGNSKATVGVASMIKHEFEVPTVAHLTCVNSSRQEIDYHIDEFKSNGIGTVLALRGDRVPGAQASDFQYAKDLIPLLVDAGFCVGAAAYPEGHIECDDLDASIRHLKEKQDAGASFLVTQLFFDNELFYRFRDKAEKAGITAPITCGIMPFLSKAQIQRMVFMCGASLPSPIIKLLAKYEDSPDDLQKAGVEYACRQLVDLAENGAEGLHVYTMNRPHIAAACAKAVRG